MPGNSSKCRNALLSPSLYAKAMTRCFLLREFATDGREKANQ